MTTPRLLGAADLAAFVAHCERHAAESGTDGDIIFMPDSIRPADELRQGLARAWGTPVAQAGWQRAWGIEVDGELAGHAALRAAGHPNSAHRTTFSLGVLRPFRGHGLGLALSTAAIAWARQQPSLDWVDLGVFEHNLPAMRLYERLGFARIGTTPDLFRVGRGSVDDVAMCLFVGESSLSAAAGGGRQPGKPGWRFAPVHLQTARLVLRTPAPADAAPVAAYLGGNWSHLAPWEPPRPPSYTTEEHWRRQIERQRRDTERGRSLLLLLVSRDDVHGAVLGLCRLSNISAGPFLACSIGYSVAKRHEGRGLMTEALQAVVAFAFDGMGLHRVMAAYVPDNRRSARVLARLGFVKEGLARDYLYIDGAWRDHVLTALTNPRAVVPVAG